MEKHLKLIDHKAIDHIVETSYNDLDIGSHNFYTHSWKELEAIYGTEEGPAYEFKKMVIQVLHSLEREGYTITKTCDASSEYFN